MSKKKVSYQEFCVTVAKDNGINHMTTKTITHSRKGNPVEPRVVEVMKSHTQIAKEAGIKIASSPCKVSEGNGFHSKGERLTYKDIINEE